MSSDFHPPSRRDGTTLRFALADLDATADLAARLAGAASPGTILALSGGLGAGKTTFVRALADRLGHDPDLVSSPTFVLMNEYRTPGCTPLVHIDAYRLSGDEELDSIGFAEALAGSPATGGRPIVAIEWPERIAPAIEVFRAEGRVIDVRLEVTSPDSREATVSLPGGVILPPSGSGAGTDVLGQARLEARPKCRTCGNAVGTEELFCSERCQMADLKRWFDGGYTISRELREDDLDEV